MASWQIWSIGPLVLLALSGCKMLDSFNEDAATTERSFDTAADQMSLGEQAEMNWRAMTGRGPDQGVAEKEFRQGEELYQQKKYVEAADHFREAGLRWPKSSLEEDALFMQAESLFFANHYNQSVQIYKRLLKRYENTRHLEMVTRRMFSVARFWETEADAQAGYLPNFTDAMYPTIGWQQSAGDVYSTIHLNDPTGPLADDTLMARGNLSFRNGEYTDADYYYEQLRRDYPESSHQAKAHLLSVESKLAAYQGPLYEGSGLSGADKISQRAVQQFSGELDEGEREALVTAQDEVHMRRARREWEMGEYYLKNENYRSARIYYQTILEEYSDTPFRKPALERMNELASMPDKGPNRFIWLAKPFEWAGLERER
jgi:outer membrane protein assembly factor BamD (BamD/ComL family)